MADELLFDALKAPQTWRDPSTHLEAVLTDPWFRAIAQLFHRIQVTSHDFYSAEGFVSASLPITTGAISSPMGLGSDSKPVEIELNGIKTFLADSAQFMLEILCRTNDKGVYYVMPSFRGEETDETHLAQFYHSEVEIPGALTDIMDLSERYLKALAGAMYEHHADLVLSAAGKLSHVEDLLNWTGQLPSIRYEDALKELSRNNTYTEKLDNGVDVISREGEAELARRFGISGSILWLTHFEQSSVPFYQALEPGTSFTMSADLLLAGRETIGAGQRHSNAAQVLSSLKSHEVPVESYAWYVKMRELVPLQTSGMGMGIERFCMWLLQKDDIRDFMFLIRENGVDHLP